jgi:hypothetical protein
MDKVTFVKYKINGVDLEYAIIDRGNEEFTSMLKSTYDEQQAEAELKPAKTSKVVNAPVSE